MFSEPRHPGVRQVRQRSDGARLGGGHKRTANTIGELRSGSNKFRPITPWRDCVKLL